MIRYTSQKQPTLPGFETPFQQELDPNNRWVKLGEVIPWDELSDVYCRQMSSGHGRPAKDPRLIIGAMILKHKQKWTDEETVRQIQENPYLQQFCGFSSFTLKPPFVPSLFVEIRKRMGADVFDSFEQALQDRLESIWVERERKKQEQESGKDDDNQPEEAQSAEQDLDTKAEPEQAVAEDHPTNSKETQSEDTSSDATINAENVEQNEPPPPQGKLIIDATVAEQAIRYPTDLGTLNEAREISEKLIDLLYPRSGLQKKPRTYRKLARQAFLSLVKKRKPRKNVLRKAIRQQLQYLRRNLGHIDALLDRYEVPFDKALGGYKPLPYQLSHRHLRQLYVIRTVYDQQKEMHDNRSRRCDHRIVSISQPHVRPIVRGRAGKAAEFGAKMSASLSSSGLARVDAIRWDAFNESGDLTAQVEAYKERYGHYPAVVLADGIYGTRENRRYCKDHGIRFGGKRVGRPKKETEANKEEILKEKKQRRQDHLERIPIEGKFGQGKNGYGLERIRAKLARTSEAWIRGIFLVMNLMVLVRLLFFSKMAGFKQAVAAFLHHVSASVRFLVYPGSQTCLSAWWCSLEAVGFLRRP